MKQHLNLEKYKEKQFNDIKRFTSNETMNTRDYALDMFLLFFSRRILGSNRVKHFKKKKRVVCKVRS